MDTFITEEGKGYLLKRGFVTDGGEPFNYLALGSVSAGVANQDADKFVEVADDTSYHRVKLESSDASTDISNVITLTGIFDNTNYTNGGNINEIAIINSYEPTSEEVKFAIMEVPLIAKNDNISLKYTIKIEML